jgi:hypothetical protein
MSREFLRVNELIARMASGRKRKSAMMDEGLD